ncbi:MAG: hypothetical protein ACYTBJ_08060 [Planctomycetota bacterium]
MSSANVSFRKGIAHMVEGAIQRRAGRAAAGFKNVDSIADGG